jgi:seryl-tRNA synthetase
VDEAGQDAFRNELIDAGLVLDAGTAGLYGRSLAYEEIAHGIISLTTRTGAADGARNLSFPPVIPRGLLERTDYLKSFPDLTGSVHTFRGDDKLHAKLLSLVESGADWAEVLEPAEVVLRPAACHPVYPLCTDGPLPEGGRRFEVLGWCFRHEPSGDPARMLAFRMHEFVYVGDAEGATAHRDVWVKRGTEMLESLGLDVDVVVANDPFFGRVGKVLAANQREEALKLEFVTPITSPESPTAITSVNRH